MKNKKPIENGETKEFKNIDTSFIIDSDGSKAKEALNKYKYNETLIGKIIKIISIIIFILFLPLLIINSTLIVKSYINKNEVPDFFGFKPFIVVTKSMEPKINAGDLIIVKDKGKDFEYKVGDIISFSEMDNDGNLIVVTHKIVAISGTGDDREIITKGENNNTTDQGFIKPEQIEGVYLFRLKGMGSFAMFLQTPIGIVVIIGIFITIFILYEMFTRKRKALQNINNKEELEIEIDRLKSIVEKTSQENIEKNTETKDENIKYIKLNDIEGKEDEKPLDIGDKTNINDKNKL